MKEKNHDQGLRNKQILHRKLDAAAWSLFFIWTGIAFLADVGWGAGLLGVGIIILGAQAARKYLELKLEGFWIAVGILFAMGGIWRFLDVQLGLLPVLCIIAGAVLLGSAVFGRWGVNGTGGIGPCPK